MQECFYCKYLYHHQQGDDKLALFGHKTKLRYLFQFHYRSKQFLTRFNERFDDKWDFCALDRQDERILEFEKGEWMQTRALRIIKLRKV